MTGVWRAATKLGVVIAITLLAAGLQELRAQQRAQSASQAGLESCARASFRVVVDVGHTAVMKINRRGPRFKKAR